MTRLPVVAVTLFSTGFFALSTTLKHRSAGSSPDTSGLRPRDVVRFLAATARSPLWLGGLVADAGGLALQVYALHIGALAVVQPLMITALVFSLVLDRTFARTWPAARELAWAAVLVVSLAGFLVVSGATSSDNTGPALAADHGPATVAAVLAGALALTCVLLARRLPHGPRAAVLGVAVGIAYAFTAALIKSCTNLVLGGPVPLLTSWQLYVLVVVGGAGLLLNQLAFQAGPLTASLPAIATVDPLLSVALGVVVYDERLRHALPAVLGEVASLALLSASAIFLSRVRAISEDQHPGDPEPPLLA